MMCNTSQREGEVKPPPLLRQKTGRIVEAKVAPEGETGSDTVFEIQGKSYSHVQQAFERSRVEAYRRGRARDTGDKKLVEADLFGMWSCPKCSHHCLPLTNACEICQTSRFAVQDRAEKPTLDRLAHLLSHIDEARKEWCSNVAQTLINDFELVVSGKAFNVLEVQIHFMTIPFNLTGEWYFGHSVDNHGQVKFHEGNRKCLGVTFVQAGLSGAVIFSAIQGQEVCTCAAKQLNCTNCNAICVGATGVVDQIIATGWWQRKVTTLVENLLLDGNLESITPNAFLYLRPLSASLGKMIESSTIALQMKDIPRYCAQSAEVASARQKLVLTLDQNGLSSAAIAEQVGGSVREVTSAIMKVPEAVVPNASNILPEAKVPDGRGSVTPGPVELSREKSSGIVAHVRTKSGKMTLSNSTSKADLSKLLMETIHGQASMLEAFFNEIYSQSPRTWSGEIMAQLVYPLSKPASTLPQAILFGERDVSIHALIVNEPRKQIWLPFFAPLFQDTSKANEEQQGNNNVVLCEECEESPVKVECESCGLFCSECAKTLHARGKRTTHKLTQIDPATLPPPPASSKKLTTGAQAQLVIACIIQWAFSNQSTEEFTSILQELQAFIESLGWNEANCTKFRGCLAASFRKLSAEIRNLRKSFHVEDFPKWDNFIALLSLVEEFCFYSPCFKFGSKPPSTVLGLHLHDTGCADKELLLLVEEILDKNLGVFGDTFLLSVEPSVLEEYRKRQKTLQGFSALAKTGVEWCNMLETEIQNDSKSLKIAATGATPAYCKAAATLATTLIQRPRFKRGCDKRQVSEELMGAVERPPKKITDVVAEDEEPPMSWEFVNVDACMTQLKAGKSSLEVLSTWFAKILEATRVFSTQLDRAVGGDDKLKGLDKMAGLEESVQMAKGLCGAMALRMKIFASELSSEVLSPLTALQRDYEREMAVFPARVQQMKV